MIKNIFKFLYSKKGNQGFTLVEMIVAVGIFALAALISLGTLLNISDMEKKAEALRSINDNLNLSLEMMLREIRSGGNYSFSGGVFSFTNNNGASVVYRLYNNRIERSESGGVYVPITAPDVIINNLNFTLRGQFSGDNLQPLVIISIKGTAITEKEKTKTTFKLQTTISQRKLDS